MNPIGVLVMKKENQQKLCCSGPYDRKYLKNGTICPLQTMLACIGPWSSWTNNSIGENYSVYHLVHKDMPNISYDEARQ